MENHVLLNNASTTLNVEAGKLGVALNAADQNQFGRAFIPMFIPTIFAVQKTVGSNGTNRTQTWTPTAANNTEYKLSILVYKEQDWGYFGPELQVFNVSYTSDATATVAEITAGITAAINAVGPAFNVTATDGGTLVTITSNGAVPQNINVYNSGAGVATVAQTVAFVKPYGTAAYLQALGLSTATAGAAYTSYEFSFVQPSDNGRVGSGTQNMNQTVWVNTGATALITAFDAFTNATFTSPAAFTLERD